MMNNNVKQKMMTKPKLAAGAVFVIADVECHDTVLALKYWQRLSKVVFVGKGEGTLFGFIVSERVFDETLFDKPALDDMAPDVAQVTFGNTMIYTFARFLKRGAWPIIGYQPVTDAEQQLTLHLVGSSLHFLDQNLGVVAAKDRKKYPNQALSFFGAVYYHINLLPPLT